MAIMIPSSISANTQSRAERKLFNQLRRDLPDDFVVLHSLGVKRHDRKVWAEADFTVVCRLGVFVIEVKGGRVSCLDGVWTYTNRFDIENTKHEGPWAQASGVMCPVRDAIRDKLKKSIRVGFGVMIPDDEFLAESPEITQEVLYDRRHRGFSLFDYIKRLAEYWNSELTRQGKAIPGELSSKEIDEIRQLLRPEVRTALTVNSVWVQAEHEQVQLTDEQTEIMRRMDCNLRTLIEGGAGTGKTIMAVDKALRFARRGKRVLFLCFNKLLGEHLKEAVSGEDLGDFLQVDSIQSFYMQGIHAAGLAHQLPAEPWSPDVFDALVPELYLEAVIEQDPVEFEVLVLDEGQDLLTSVNLDVFDLILQGGLNNGAWHVFYDGQQNIFHGLAEDAIKQLRSAGCAEFTLTVNCRNMKRVAIMTSIVSDFALQLDGCIDAGASDCHWLGDEDSVGQQVESIIKGLMKKGLERQHIVVLGGRRLENSSVSEGKVGEFFLNDLTQAESVSKKQVIDYCTIHAFKGLERRAVIAIDIEDLPDQQKRLLHYCGLSRARAVLHVILKERERVAFDKNSGRFGARELPGSDEESGSRVNV